MAKPRTPRESRSPAKHSLLVGCPGGECTCRKCTPYEDWNVQDFFGVASAQRGFEYARDFRVLEYSIDEDWGFMSGLVKGTRLYLTYVKLNPKNRILPIVDAGCDCPVMRVCKHGAALLYHVLRERSGDYQLEIERQANGDGLRVSETDDEQGISNGNGNGDTDYDCEGTGLSRSLQAQSRPQGQAQPPPKHPLIDSWVQDLRKISESASRKDKLKSSKKLLYLLSTGSGEKQYLRLETVTATRLKNGGYGREDRYDLSTGRAGFLESTDRMVGALLGSMRTGYWLDYSFETSEPELIDLLLQSIILTGRCFWRDKDTEPLTLGDPRPGQLVWIVDEFGRQRTTVTIPNVQVLLSPSPWYVDTVKGAAGRIELPFPTDLVEPILFGPRLDIEQAKYTRDLLRERLPELELPLPAETVHIEHHDVPPVPVLYLMKFDNGIDKEAAYAYHWVKYGNTRCMPTETGNSVTKNGTNGTLVYKRHPKLERAFIEKLSGDMQLASAHFPQKHDGMCFLLPSGNALIDFMALDIPALERAGWDILYDKSFVDRIVEPDDDDWEAEIVDEEGWFSCQLGITVKGERVSLFPLLVAAVRSLPYTVKHAREGESVINDEFLEALNHAGRFYVTMPDGGKLSLPFERVKSLLKILVELFNEDSVRKGRIKINVGQLMQLLGEEQPLIFKGGEKLQALAKSMMAASKTWPTHVTPKTFGVTLRDYQARGVAWLQFIAHHNAGGLLADEMGLGKTVEALAHIQVEYENDRLTKPVLIVCPTSVLPNWMDETQRMVPHLKVVSMRDQGRFTRQSQLDGADIVLTTYPLLLRDASLLTLRQWHLVVLDEAQVIKNRKTLAADACRRLKADHRLCMTGTPVENHLGDLWSLFAVLMPGLLNTYEIFKDVFRDPIEKYGDAYARAFLAARIRPFLLRRTKAEVGEQLPKKTETQRTIELQGGQRDLYETVRLAMNKIVLEEVSKKGINKSQIAILKALLRLRQVCCDPRLCKLPEAENVAERAKLDELLELLPTLVESGRRILIFSYFTSMLDLVEPHLIDLGIKYVQLRGSTKDRKTPVKLFQSGKIPVFLISLKAGGTGLNLTAADTVIHLDPWWNPAVEEQATDRAHRIGQDKPVFVYRLITRGTVEERMLQLQATKRILAEGIYDQRPDAEGGSNFTERDLKFLLAPLDE